MDGTPAANKLCFALGGGGDGAEEGCVCVILPTEVAARPISHAKADAAVSSNLTAGKVWPASILLAHFLLHHRARLQGKKIFEFGSGMAVPSLAALKSGAVAGVYLQELDIAPLLSMQRAIFEANGLPAAPPLLVQLPLAWGVLPVEFVEAHGREPIGLFVAADCLYERKDFADLVATAAFLLDHFRGAPLVTCYQDRNMLYSLDELFEHWGLKAALLPSASFAFDAEAFLRRNGAHPVDDFPPPSEIDSVLFTLEVCRRDQPFTFASAQ